MSGRGRTKRTKTASDVAESDLMSAKASTLEAEPVKETKKTTKKKQFPVVAVITPDGIEGNLMAVTTRRPLVVHLPIQSRDVPMNDMPIAYNPLPPTEAQPYDREAENPFSEVMEVMEPPPSVAGHSAMTDSEPPAKTATQRATSQEELDFYRLKGTFLFQFKDSSETMTLPAHSEAACFWCCHTFPHRPVVLPLRDTGDAMIVSGNFCCPECACSYLFDMRQDAHTRWEQLALLHRVYGAACGGTIRPAPPKTLLSYFGGCLSIQQYRQLIQSHTVRVDVHLPPMVSILATMDTKPIDFYDANLTKNVSETVTERLQKAEEVLRLRRTKPLKAWESTLDACINLKIKYDSG